MRLPPTGQERHGKQAQRGKQIRMKVIILNIAGSGRFRNWNKSRLQSETRWKEGQSSRQEGGEKETGK